MQGFEDLLVARVAGQFLEIREGLDQLSEFREADRQRIAIRIGPRQDGPQVLAVSPMEFVGGHGGKEQAQPQAAGRLLEVHRHHHVQEG